MVSTPKTLPEYLLLKRLTKVSGLLAARTGIVLIGSDIPGNKTIALRPAVIWNLLGSILANHAARPPGRFAGIVIQAVLVLIVVA